MTAAIFIALVLLFWASFALGHSLGNRSGSTRTEVQDRGGHVGHPISVTVGDQGPELVILMRLRGEDDEVTS